MVSRLRIALGMTLIFAFLFGTPVFAGGWAVITLDDLPTYIAAGEPLTVGFTVLQHGKTPLDGLEPTVTAYLNNEQKFVVEAEPDGPSGHYTAKLIFPKEGDWRWSIRAFGMEQLMPTLRISEPVVEVVSQPDVKSESLAKSESMLRIVRLSALGVGLGGLIFAFRRRSRLGMALAVVCLSVGVGSFMTAPAVPAVEAQVESSSEVLSESSVSQVELGGQLFVAKGCIACHANNKVENASDYWRTDAGPNLTTFSASPEALRLRLKDPSSVKSDTQMPDLNLSEFEIEALIVFINSK